MRSIRVAAVAWLAIVGFASTAATADLRQSIERGDSLYHQAELVAAREAYRAALESEPSSFTALVRLARTESDLGEDAKGDEQKRLTAAAVEHARAAVR